MNKSEITILGNYTDPSNVDFDASLTFSIKSDLIKKETLWKSKNLTAEFFGDFWKHILDIESIKGTVHFICAELLENAVNYSMNQEYMIVIQLCFKSDELLVYVTNNSQTDQVDDFMEYINSILRSDNLQKMFVQRMRDAKETSSKKSQVGLITILKDRGAKLAWKFEPYSDFTKVTTLARLYVKGCLK